MSAPPISTLEQQHDVILSLLGEVARNYIDLRALQHRLDITEQNLLIQKRTLAINTEQYSRGLVNELDVTRAKAEVSTTGAQIPPLRSEILQSIHRLSILLNRQPTALTRELVQPAPVPSPPAEVPIGLPSDLLLRRPDLRRAERMLAAETAQTGIATADLFPRFSLTGPIGLQSTEPGNLVEYASRYYSIGPMVSWPVFDASKTRNRLRAAEARQEQAKITFERTVLAALKDVEDDLVIYNKAQERTKMLQDAVAANEQSVRISSDLYAQGLTDFLNVLDAQRSLLSSQDSLAVSESEVSTSLVSLYKSLGGGWNIEPPAAGKTK